MNNEVGQWMKNDQIGNKNCKLGWNHSCNEIIEDSLLMSNHEWAIQREIMSKLYLLTNETTFKYSQEEVYRVCSH